MKNRAGDNCQNPASSREIRHRQRILQPGFFLQKETVMQEMIPEKNCHTGNDSRMTVV
jgi:hypothetical protein